MNRKNIDLIGSELISVINLEKGINPSEKVQVEIKYKSGDIVEGEVVFGKKDTFLLPPGKFVVAVNSREKEFKDLLVFNSKNFYDKRGHFRELVIQKYLKE